VAAGDDRLLAAWPNYNFSRRTVANRRARPLLARIRCPRHPGPAPTQPQGSSSIHITQPASISPAGTGAPLQQEGHFNRQTNPTTKSVKSFLATRQVYAVNQAPAGRDSPSMRLLNELLEGSSQGRIFNQPRVSNRFLSSKPVDFASSFLRTWRAGPGRAQSKFVIRVPQNAAGWGGRCCVFRDRSGPPPASALFTEAPCWRGLLPPLPLVWAKATHRPRRLKRRELYPAMAPRHALPQADWSI